MRADTCRRPASTSAAACFRQAMPKASRHGAEQKRCGLPPLARGVKPKLHHRQFMLPAPRAPRAPRPRTSRRTRSRIPHGRRATLHQRRCASLLTDHADMARRLAAVVAAPFANKVVALRGLSEQQYFGGRRFPDIARLWHRQLGHDCRPARRRTMRKRTCRLECRLLGVERTYLGHGRIVCL